MNGRQPMLPVDVQFGVRMPEIVASTSHSYIQKLQKRLEWAYKTALGVSKGNKNVPKSNMIKMLDVLN